MPTSTNRCPKTTIASPRPVRRWRAAALTFVSTYAYTHHPSVLDDLRRHDTQSHGHFHHVYREPEANRVNLERAHRILCSSGFEPVGFRGPARPLAREPGRPARRPRLSLLVRLSDRLRRLSVLSLEGRPILAGPADPGPPGLRGAVPRGGRRRPGIDRRVFPPGRRARSSMPASWPSSMAIPSGGWAGCPRS